MDVHGQCNTMTFIGPPAPELISEILMETEAQPQWRPAGVWSGRVNLGVSIDAEYREA